MRAMRTTGKLAPIFSSQRVNGECIYSHSGMTIHTPDQNQAHLQNQFQLCLNHVLRAVVEQFGAVTCMFLVSISFFKMDKKFKHTSLEHKSFSQGDISQALF